MDIAAEKIPSYLEWRKQSQKEFNAFPMGFAYDNEQFEEAKKELGVKENSELIRVTSCGFIRKADRDSFLAMNNRHGEQFKRYKQDKKFVYEMFRYELANHEYVITFDIDDTLDACGITFEEYRANPMYMEQMEKAKNDYLANWRYE